MAKRGEISKEFWRRMRAAARKGRTMETFEEWQNAREYLDDLSDFSGYADSGYAYGNGCFIEDVKHEDGRWSLCIGNQDWLTDDLESLERRLYDWWKSQIVGEIENADLFR